MSRLTDIRAICLDLDGTLYSQARLHKAMAIRLLVNLIANPRKGYQVVRILSAYRKAQELLRQASHVNNIGDAQLGLTCELTGQSKQSVATCIEEWFQNAPLALLPELVQPGLFQFLTSAKARDIKIAVVSDYPAQAKLRALNISGFIDVVVCAQDPDVQRLKPDPTSLIVALSRLDVQPQHAVYVGDRINVDGEAARRASVRFALLGCDSDKSTHSTLACADFQQMTTLLFH